MKLNPGASGCDSSDCGCGPQAAPGGGVGRRDFLRLAGFGAAALLTRGLPAMAGPFERADFDRLVPADKKLAPAWVKSLTDRGAAAVYQGDELQYIGMPVGGIGAGQLYLGGDGRLWHWDLFNNTQGTGADHYAHPPKPQSPVDQGFAIRVTAGGKSRTRTLDRAGFPEVRFRGQYPIGTVEYPGGDFPVSVTLEAFSPFIPLATDDSSLPATVLRFNVRNTSAEEVEGTLAGWLQNAVSRAEPWGQATRRNRIVRGAGMSMLLCSAEQPAAAASQPARPDVVFEDWNKDTYEGWKVEGTAFGPGPAKRADVPAYMGDLGGDGGRVANSHVLAPGDSVEAKDARTGRLTSRPFTIERRFINFWIGGGGHAGRTCLNLVVDGKVARTATGSNENHMSLRGFDVGPFHGKEAALEIVDAEKGPWGNIGVGKITFADRPASEENPGSAADFGTMGLALLGAPPEHAAAAGGSGGLGGKAGDDESAALAEPLVGAVGRNFRLPAGGSASIDFVLAWHFPNLRIKGLSSVGRHYAVKFDSARAVAQHVTDHFDRLTSQTKLWRDTWYDSTLPHWFLDRTFLNASILATGTCYRLADGRFYAWEGVGCCPGTCTHVWHYAHAAARLFPDLERDTRERVDLGVGFDAATGVMGFRAEFDRGLAVDGQAGTLLRILREHQTSTDDGFLRRNWPKIKKAFEPLLKLDGNDDGILEGAQMNTLDEPWYGKIAWLSSLYLAAVLAGERMAREMGEAPFADRCRAIAGRGAANLVAQLFEGEYFLNKTVPDKLDAINSGTGCEIDQVFGQSWAFQLHLGRVLPREQTATALKSLWKYNFTPDVGPYRKAYRPGRWYAMPGEAGLLMCSFPRTDWDYDNAKGKGPEWAAGYFNECMNGFEHQAAGHMIWEGLVQEGLAVERAIHDRYHPSRRNPWNEVECGDHYARSMASYGVFLAACGYEYDGPRGYLAFAPRLTPEEFKAAFTSAAGWGTYSQKREGATWRQTIELKWGSLTVKELAFAVAPGAAAAPPKVEVSVNGKAVAATSRRTEGRASISLDAAVTIGAGQTIAIMIG